MNIKTKQIALAGALLSAAFLSAGPLAQKSYSQNGASFGGKEDTEFASKLWSEMTKARLVGAKSLNTHPYKGQAPHGAILQTIDTSIIVDGREGRVIVKKNYGPEGVSTKDVWREPDKHLKAVTVMFKREDGYDKDNDNWFWAKYLANGSLDKNPKGMLLAGRVAKGADQGCIACHSAADGKDYLFTNDQ